MTFPIDLHLGPITIPSHLIFDILSLVAAAKYYEVVKARTTDHLSENNRFFVVVAAGLGAFLGARLLGALEYPDQFFNPPSILFYLASKTLVGGLVGGILAVELVKKWAGEKKRSGDIFVYPAILGIAVSRIGCLLTGVVDQTVGLPSSLPWAFDQGDGIPRHPTSLYEILFMGLMWFVFVQLQKRYVLKEGALFRLFVVGYLSFRFFVEFIKPVTPLIFGLSGIQLTSIVFAGYYVWTLLFEFDGPFAAKRVYGSIKK